MKEIICPVCGKPIQFTDERTYNYVKTRLNGESSIVTLHCGTCGYSFNAYEPYDGKGYENLVSKVAEKFNNFKEACVKETAKEVVQYDQA